MANRIPLAALLVLTLAAGAFGQQQPATNSPEAVVAPPALSTAAPVIEAANPPMGCGVCNDCFNPAPCPPGRVWGGVDALLWWIKAANLPPLITTSPAGTPRLQAGVYGQPGTSVVFGNNWVNGGMRGGTQVNLGYWFNEEQTFGIQGNFFYLQNLGNIYAAASNGTPILARPFNDALNGQPASTLIAFPGVNVGNISVDATSTSLIGTGILLRENVCCRSNFRLDALAGYRYLHFGDGVRVNETIINTGASSLVPIGTQLAATDIFSANNNFNGFDCGVVGTYCSGRWLLEAQAKVAAGATSETLRVRGGTTINVPGAAPAVYNAGLLALGTNIGNFHNRTYNLVPEFGCRVGYRLTSSIYCYAAYTFLYWSSVARAGNQIDQSVNPNLIPPVIGAANGVSHPAPMLNATDMWAQGLSLGLEFRF